MKNQQKKIFLPDFVVKEFSEQGFFPIPINLRDCQDDLQSKLCFNSLSWCEASIAQSFFYETENK